MEPLTTFQANDQEDIVKREEEKLFQKYKNKTLLKRPRMTNKQVIHKKTKFFFYFI